METLTYPKIQTIWKRDPEKKYCIIPGDYSLEEFKSICRWSISEKINGTNIRIIYEPGIPINTPEDGVEFRGKTDNAQIPPILLSHLQKTFIREKLDKAFSNTPVILFGEGFGKKIQKGGRYLLNSNSFALFDVYVNGWWLTVEDVYSIAKTLNISSPPHLGIMNTDDAVSLVKNGFLSKIAEDGSLPAEGIVAKSYPLMLSRGKERIVWKLKVKDYEALNRWGE